MKPSRKSRLRIPSRLAAGLIVAGAVASGCSTTAPALIITADQPSAVPAGHNWAFQDFFPRTLTVAQGTTIGFNVQAHHTATLLPPTMPGWPFDS